MSKRANPTAIGAFVVGALALAIFAVGLLGSGMLGANHQHFVLFFNSDVSGLRAGAPVKFRGVEIGSVEEVLLTLRGITRGNIESVRVPVVISIDNDKLKERGVEVRLNDPEMFKRIIASGLRGQLSTESIVTGVLYVRLDLFPGTQELYSFDTGVNYPQIPTVPTEFEQVEMRAAQFIAKLDRIDFDGLIASIISAAKGVDTLVNSPDLKNTIESLGGTVRSLQQTSDSIRQLADNMNENVAPLRASLERTAGEADTALRSTRATIEDVQRSLGGDAPLWADLQTALHDVSSAAQSVRDLANYLEHNPGALLRGKAAPAVEETKP